MRIVRCIIWRQWLGRGRLTIVKLRTCPLVASVALLPYPRTCFSRLPSFFVLLYEGTKSAVQSKTSTTCMSSLQNELRADQLYSVSLRTACVCVVPIRVLRACGHLGLWCPIYVMRECLFVCVAGCWVLICDACRHQVQASLVHRDWMQVQTILRSTMDSSEPQRAACSL